MYCLLFPIFAGLVLKRALEMLDLVTLGPGPTTP